MPSYDQEKLKQLFKGEKMLDSLYVYQNYLYQMLLKSLRLYNEKHSVEIRLYNMLAEAGILDAKGFRKEAFQLLQKAKKLAETHHNFLIILEILKRQVRYIVATREKNVLEETQEVYQEITTIIQTLEEEFTYRWLGHCMLICTRKNKQLAADQHGKLLQMVSTHPILNSNVRPKSFYAQTGKNYIQYLEAKIYGDRDLAYRANKKSIDIWDEHKAIKAANPQLYKIQISNFLFAAIDGNMVEDFEIYLNKIKGLTSRNKLEEVESFQNIISLELYFYLSQNRLVEAKKLLPEFEQGLKRFSGLLNQARLMANFYNILVLHFMLEEFEQTLDWVDRILRKQKTEPRQDLKTFAQILEFVIHYELGNDLMLHSLFQSTTRRLKNIGAAGKYEQLILNFFKQLIKVITRKEKLECMKDFREQLSPMTKLKPIPTGSEELVMWLTARIEGKTIREIFQSGLEK